VEDVAARFLFISLLGGLGFVGKLNSGGVLS